jgi:2,4-didehydro-3-deoxy-L-rhamnonate hydrolase
MKVCRFNNDRYGVVEDGVVRDVTSVLDSALGPFQLPLPNFDPVIAAFGELAPQMAAAAKGAPGQPLDGVRLLAPVARPGKIIAAPVNYMKHLEEVRLNDDLNYGVQAHINEIRNVGLFLKATSSLIGVSDSVRLKFPDRRNDHEVELALIVGRKASDVREEDALDYIAGYSIGLDMTLRGPEERSLRKSIDTYTVLGPWLITPDEFAFLAMKRSN